jgi:hypothetical protein
VSPLYIIYTFLIDVHFTSQALSRPLQVFSVPDVHKMQRVASARPQRFTDTRAHTTRDTAARKEHREQCVPLLFSCDARRLARRILR